MPQKKILVVDDDPTILQTVEAMLEGDYDVHVAEGGKAAMEQLQAQNGQYDVLLCDLGMPGMNGAFLYLHILKAFPGLEARIIFMTGGPFDAFIEEFAINTSNPCLKKPFSRDALRSMVAEMLSKQS